MGTNTFTALQTVSTAAGTTAISGTHTAGSGFTKGVYGESLSTDGTGVHGVHTATTGIYAGIAGESFSTDAFAVGGAGTITSAAPGGYSAGVRGINNGTGVNGIGVWGSHGGSGWGVFGTTLSGRGVHGISLAGTGLNYGGYFQSNSTTGRGVQGTGSALTGANYGVYGISLSSTGTGDYGSAAQNNGINFGVYGSSASSVGFAGYFSGKVHVTGALTKGSGTFKIDHPLDPENRYLSHSFVESPDMMNIYNGNVITDASGAAVVEMPDYFETLNRDFRYQLTVIGQFAQAMAAEEISGGRFAIKTDKPGVKVSWQVTGVRQDPFAEVHRVKVEEDKSAEERGYYLHPTEYGQPKEKGIEQLHHPSDAAVTENAGEGQETVARR